MKDISSLRIAIIGVSHWHVPLYLTNAKKDGMRIVAVSDPNETIVSRFAQALDAKGYTRYLELLVTEKPDFVFAFAPHNQMAELALELIAREIPFTMEKPVGVDYEQVSRVRKICDEAKGFCAIPFIWRYSEFLQDFKKEIAHEKIVHLAFKFIAGPPQRYLATSPWMLQKEMAGGGCMTNLGVHFIDMAMFLTGSSQGDVLASQYHYHPAYDVETYAVSVARLETGASMCLETGYAYPMDERAKRHNLWNIVTDQGFYTLGDNHFEKRKLPDKIQQINMNTDSDIYYPVFAKTSLEDFLAGRKPRATLREMELVSKFLADMQAKAEGGAI